MRSHSVNVSATGPRGAERPLGMSTATLRTTRETQTGPAWQPFLDGCPAAACIARVSDGAIVAFNDRFRTLAALPGNGAIPRNARLELWTDGEGCDELRAGLSESALRRDLPAHFRSAPGQPAQKVIVNLLTAPLTNATLLIAILQSAGPAAEPEPALTKARDTALESARLKSEFLANISHEIRTPLNGIIGMTQLLRDTKLGSLQRNFTETIRLSADHLLQLINEILDFSKLEAGKLQLEHAPYDLPAAVENTLDLLAERAHSKGLELTYLIQPDLPTRIMGDSGRVRQVLTNLISNAIKFTDRGEVSLEVTVEAGDDGQPALKFEIADTGIGIPEQAMPRLFQMFEQVDSSTSRRFGGTGLGLAICRQLVEVMNGTIGVASKPASGSIFWFRLPLEVQPQPESQSVADPPGRLRGLRVLLVESNATTARSIMVTLAHLGVDFVHVERGQDGLAALREAAREGRPLGIAVIDMASPGMDGLVLARAIKVDAAISDTRILLLTRLNQQLETSQLHASNVGACLTKPLKLSRLADYLVATLSDAPRPKPAAQREADLIDPFTDLGFVAPATPLRIMIAEDNPINQKVARGLLSRLGHASETVDTGRKLLRAVELAPYDIIFMDCQLPELDGLQATRELRRREASGENGRRTYIIAMTADVVTGARDRCLAAGMDDYLSKPIRLDELHSVLRRASEFVKVTAGRSGKRPPGGVLDVRVMETLRLLRVPGQPDPLPALFAEFVEHAEHRLDEIQGAAMNHDAHTLEHASHSLRGSAAGIGAARLSELAAELEEGAKNGCFQRTAEMLSQLEEEFQRVRRSLEFERER